MTAFMGRQPLYEQLANMLRYRIENEMVLVEENQPEAFIALLCGVIKTSLILFYLT